MLLQKLETLTQYLLATTEWRERFEGTTAFHDTTSTHPATVFFPLEAMAILYFHDLKEPVASYTAQLRSYYRWSLQHLRDTDMQPPGLPPQPLIARLRVSDEHGLNHQMETLLRMHSSLAKAIGLQADRLLDRT
ncbi:MAG: hypothetical protein RBS80_07700 [Thermoguttaceae bacterium]|jgi:hypothetical protein|nr:hypothetical protein [Thermoguttaceae bacterium]